jgi:predicted enzyme related to lactoylglutathione lyase
MKCLHVHVVVNDIKHAIDFYSTLFKADPSVFRPDYAKWMLEDSRVNFAISARGTGQAGLDHLGIQAEDAAELGEVYNRLQAADGPVEEEGAVTCCYHQSEKSWIADFNGLRWEAFLTHGEATVYGDGGRDARAGVACCGDVVAETRAEPCCMQAPEAGCCVRVAE